MTARQHFARMPIFVPFISGYGSQGLIDGGGAFKEFLLEHVGAYREVKNNFFCKHRVLNINNKFSNHRNEKIIKTYQDAYKHGTSPIFFGGDHGITFFLVEAALSIWSNMALVVFDAHSDAQGDEKELRNWNFLRQIKAVSEKTIKIIHVGFRDTDEFVLKQYTDASISMFDLVEKGCASAANLIKKEIDNYSVYLSIDLDVIDPLLFSAVNAPISSGLLPQQLFFIIQSLNFQNIIGADIVEYDHFRSKGNELFFLADLFFNVGEICEHHNSIYC